MVIKSHNKKLLIYLRLTIFINIILLFINISKIYSNTTKINNLKFKIETIVLPTISVNVNNNYSQICD